ncbi:MAG: LEA type 2 family protein [Myxococcales bacterium]
MKTRLATLLPLLALAACADNNASVHLAAICAPPDDASACEFNATCEAQYIGFTQLDVALANKLWLLVQVDNQTPNNSKGDAFRTNTNDAFVQEYEIEYPGTGFPTARGPIPGSARVPAAGSAVISLPAVDEATTTRVANALPLVGSQIDGVAQVKLRGVYADTTSFVTGVFEIPIRACRGCLPVLGCPTLGDVLVFCPQDGQTPASASCVTP